MTYNVLILAPELSQLGIGVHDYFSATHISEWQQLPLVLAKARHHVIVVDFAGNQPDFSRCERLLAELPQNVPLIVLTSRYSLADKLHAFEIGCDDFIDGSAPLEETCARITKSIFNQIAYDQLKTRASGVKRRMVASDLAEANLEGLVDYALSLQHCDNLDELGQQFFAAAAEYGLSCSLQMRGVTAVKNMEAHGMAKELESQLISQFMHKGELVDLGRRVLLNHRRASLLLKNLPQDRGENDRLRTIGNILLGGVDARIQCLDDRQRLVEAEHLIETLYCGIWRTVTEFERRACGLADNAERPVTERLRVSTGSTRKPDRAVTEGDILRLRSLAEQTPELRAEGLMLVRLLEVVLQASEPTPAAHDTAKVPNPDVVRPLFPPAHKD